LLATVTRLIRDSKVPPVIVLQGDHGTSFLQYSTAIDPSLVPPSAARERLGAFGAYYFPGIAPEALGDTVSVVNVLGHVLRQYFGADLPPDPNTHYISLESSPFELQQVDAGWIAPASPGAGASP
ncbi:MAG TPA: hypothetical protein VLH58_09130, partial [Candidatus Methylomirabilis sp.]|nr:hypothetical protein [Candidatus Methylomirabilis sp.]